MPRVVGRAAGSHHGRGRSSGRSSGRTGVLDPTTTARRSNGRRSYASCSSSDCVRPQLRHRRTSGRWFATRGSLSSVCTMTLTEPHASHEAMHAHLPSVTPGRGGAEPGEGPVGTRCTSRDHDSGRRARRGRGRPADRCRRTPSTARSPGIRRTASAVGRRRERSRRGCSAAAAARLRGRRDAGRQHSAVERRPRRPADTGSRVRLTRLLRPCQGRRTSSDLLVEGRHDTASAGRASRPAVRRT